MAAASTPLRQRQQQQQQPEVFRSNSSGSSSSSWEARCWLFPAALDPRGTLHRRFTRELLSSFEIDLSGDLTEEAVSELRRLRLPILLTLLLWSAVGCLQTICMISGWTILFSTASVPRQCLALWYLALGFCSAVCSLLICPLPAELAVVTCTVLAEVARWLGGGCSNELHGFLEMVRTMGLPSVVCAAAATGVAHVTLSRMRQTHSRWCKDGPASDEVISLAVAASEFDDVELADAECVVCMAEGSEASWVKLKCGHRFHEDCLRAWLGRSSRCPLCRLDLRAVYSDP